MNQSRPRILTLRKSQKIPLDDGSQPQQCRYYTGVHRPFTSMLNSYPTPDEVQNVKTKYANYQKQVEAKQAMDEIAAFEQKTTGKKSNLTPSIPLTPLDRGELRILELASPPQYTQFYDVYDSNKNTFQKKQVPAPWSILDEPLVPARPTKLQSKPLPKRHPFVDSYKEARPNGIPLLSADLKKQHRHQLDKYAASVRYLQTCENQRQENQVKQLVERNLESMRRKREIESSLAAKTGQNWVLRKITQTQLSKRKAKTIPAQLDQDDIESLKFLQERDKELAKQEKMTFTQDDS